MYNSVLVGRLDSPSAFACFLDDKTTLSPDRFRLGESGEGPESQAPAVTRVCTYAALLQAGPDQSSSPQARGKPCTAAGPSPDDLLGKLCHPILEESLRQASCILKFGNHCSRMSSDLPGKQGHPCKTEWPRLPVPQLFLPGVTSGFS